MFSYKKCIIGIVSFFLTVGIITHFVFTRDFILRKINSYILDYKWSINFKSHSGSIFSKILLDDISIVKDNEQIIRFQKLIIDIAVFETIFSKPTVDMLTVQNIDLNLKSKSNEEKFLDDLDYSFLNFFEIKQLLISGNFNFDFNGKNLKSKVELLGSINRRRLRTDKC